MPLNFRLNNTNYTVYTSTYYHPVGAVKKLWFKSPTSSNNYAAHFVADSDHIVSWGSIQSGNYYNSSKPTIHMRIGDQTLHAVNDTITPTVTIDYGAKYYSSSDGDLTVRSISVNKYLPGELKITLRHVGCSESKTMNIAAGSLSNSTSTSMTAGSDGVKRFYLDIEYSNPGGSYHYYYPLPYTNTSNSYTYKTVSFTFSNCTSTAPTS